MSTSKRKGKKKQSAKESAIPAPPSPEVYIVVRVKKRTFYLKATEATLVIEIKKNVETAMKIPVASQRYNLHNSEEEMENTKCLSDYGITEAITSAVTPAFIALTVKSPDGTFGPVDITPMEIPPEFPDVTLLISPKDEI